jgi:hypothetical protein
MAGNLAGWLVGLAQAPMKRRVRSTVLYVPNYTNSVQDLRGSTNLAGARGKREREKKKILVVAYSTVGISNIATRLWNNMKYGGCRECRGRVKPTRKKKEGKIREEGISAKGGVQKEV